MITFKEINNVSTITLDGVKNALVKTQLIKKVNIYDVTISGDAINFWVKSKLDNSTVGSFEIYRFGDIDFIPAKQFSNIFTLSKDYNKVSYLGEVLSIIGNYKISLKELFDYLIK